MSSCCTCTIHLELEVDLRLWSWLHLLQPSDFLSVHLPLHLQSPFHYAPEMCRWHRPYWTSLSWEWVCQQVSNHGDFVQSQQLRTQRSKNREDDCGFLKKRRPTRPNHRDFSFNAVESFHILLPLHRTSSGSRTSYPSLKRPSWRCSFCGSWRCFLHLQDPEAGRYDCGWALPPWTL